MTTGSNQNTDPNSTPEETAPTPEAPKRPAWEYKTQLGINSRLKEIVLHTKAATEIELDAKRRQLEKLLRGS